MAGVAEVDEPYLGAFQCGFGFVELHAEVARMQVSVDEAGALHREERHQELSSEHDASLRAQPSPFGSCQDVKRFAEAPARNVIHQEGGVPVS